MSNVINPRMRRRLRYLESFPLETDGRCFFRSAATQAMNVELGPLNGEQQILFGGIKEIEAANLNAMICFWLG